MNTEKIMHQHLIDLPISSVNCSHCTLGNPEGHAKFSQDFRYQKIIEICQYLAELLKIEKWLNCDQCTLHTIQITRNRT